MKRIFACIPFFFLLLLLIFSCHKSAPTSVIISVVDSSSGVPIVDATVQLYIPATLIPKTKTLDLPTPEKQNTDAKGEAVFTVKHVAIFYANVYKAPTLPEDGVHTLVRFEEEKTITQVIKY